jgi:class 3 adenylate cyclase/predicted ATPase
MQQTADWLEKLGMSEYARRFAENGINFQALRYLTDQDLKDIGVLLGHRRIMLAAIAELAGPAVTTPHRAPIIEPKPQDPGAVATPAAATPPIAANATGERRYLTVMFCDLVDSTGIASRLDAEEWRDLVGSYLDAASAAVTEMGGHVVKKLGDGLLSVFGYPVAHENDAERAARAAISIQRALADLNRKNSGVGRPELSARIGLETGPAVVDATGEIYGDVANVAARVQALADPSSVLITANVQRQIAGLFVAEAQGSFELKGVPEPVTLFRLVRASGAGRRSVQRHLTPLVGREEEIAMLMRRWERARQGDGQLVMIVGEPGLGKSRLIEEFHGRLRDVPHTWAEWSCSQLLQNTPLHPVTEWGRTRFGGGEIPAERQLADLESTLALIKLDPAENMLLLAPLLDIPLPRERALNIPPEELRRRQLAALAAFVMAGARSQPIVLAVEDAHWADPTTIDVLRGIAERGALAPLFLLITARPEFRAPWGVRSHHGTISLVPLDRHQVQHMVSELASRHALSKELVEGVAQRTGGVPLFVEEVTRLLLERGEQGGTQAIPPTLQHSLMARLDRLGPAREVAQIGAVIGRDFSYALIRTVAGTDESTLRTALERLAEADILLVQGEHTDSNYRFKHALIQDAAYENLLKSRRQVLHRRIAEALRENLTGTTTIEPELIAHHFAQAGLMEGAIEWWGKAGQWSLERSAFVEAVGHFSRALAQIATLPATPALRREEIKLQVALITPIIHVNGFAAPETKAAVDRANLLIERAEAIHEAPEDLLLLFSVLYGLWVAQAVAFNDSDLVLELAKQTLAHAERRRATVPLMIGHRLMGTSLIYTGDLIESRNHFDQVIELYDPTEHRPLATRLGHDLRAAALSFRSWGVWLLGFPEAGVADADRALSDARELGQAGTLMFALTITTLARIFCGNYATAIRSSDELIALADQADGALWRAWGTLHRGRALALSGKVAEAVPVISAGISASRSTGAGYLLPLCLSDLAWAHAELGQFDDALRYISEAIMTVKTTKEKWFEAEASRVAGEITLKSPEPDAAKAQAYFEGSLATARGQQAKSWELRAAMSMARLWRDQGKPRQAFELLAPIYGWFTEGLDTADLKEARILLKNLES